MLRPLLTIANNAGLNVEEVMQQIMLAESEHFTIDTQTRKYGDFLTLGVMDSVKVAQLALRSAVSVVGTLITSDVVITHTLDLSVMSGYSPEWAAATREDPRAP